MDRPIIFSGPMVRALLDGRKTQTRRIIKPQPEKTPSGLWHVKGTGGGCFVNERDLPHALLDYVRFDIGVRLWVRENFRPVHSADPSRGAKYMADAGRDQTKWKPSTHMPRWASRLTLLVTGVKVERLKGISREDAIAEGIRPFGQSHEFDLYTHDLAEGRHGSPISTFADLWRTINGDDAWDANPWVVALTFTVHEANIDSLPTAETA